MKNESSSKNHDTDDSFHMKWKDISNEDHDILKWCLETEKFIYCWNVNYTTSKNFFLIKMTVNN